MNTDPETGQMLKQVLGVEDDYYADVPPDPPDDQVSLYLDALMVLTPDGR